MGGMFKGSVHYFFVLEAFQAAVDLAIVRFQRRGYVSCSLRAFSCEENVNLGIRLRKSEVHEGFDYLFLTQFCHVPFRALK
jgi:hypothetical protein